jgi:exodeoxyribonuclease VII small subunit
MTEDYDLFDGDEFETVPDAFEPAPPKPAPEPPAATAEGEGITFEAALSKLEEIVAGMESGQLSLEACMKYFEDGTRLAKFCTARLEETEKKVEILLQNSGTGEWEQFEK